MQNNFFKFLLLFKLIILSPNIILSATSDVELMKQKWPFNGIFGRFDESSLQRGFQVYREVCAACHGIRHISYRDLKGIGYSDDEIKVIASDYQVLDGPNDDGEMFERDARASDKFVGPYENDKIARLANNGAYPPDLSLIVKARADGANYLYSLLNGYKEFPDNFEASEGMYYNEFYPGNQIAMPSPLMDDIIEYSDGTEATQSQIAKDVTSFLAWTAEPELEERKSLGVKALFFLILLTIMLLGVKRKVWKDVE
ncbi:MAG: cytochrome c1 [Pseudomonadota bacterium]|nr:cytochrome c1 [Pseudomonadota bacterium]